MLRCSDGHWPVISTSLPQTYSMIESQCHEFSSRNRNRSVKDWNRSVSTYRIFLKAVFSAIHGIWRQFVRLSFVRLTRLILRFVFFLFHFFLRLVFCHLMSKIVFNVMMVCCKRQHNKIMQSKMTTTARNLFASIYDKININIDKINIFGKIAQNRKKLNWVVKKYYTT